MWIANVGDSHAVLAKGGDVIQLSVDHEPNTERGSIENRGGFVSNVPGDVPRVYRPFHVLLETSLKSHLRWDPDIRNEDVTANNDLLILASDDSWKRCFK